MAPNVLGGSLISTRMNVCKTRVVIVCLLFHNKIVEIDDNF